MEVLPAINFDNQSALMTNEVYDVLAKRCLAAKAETAEAMSPQRIPKLPFRASH